MAYFRAHGARVDIENNKGRTPRQLAEQRYSEIKQGSMKAERDRTDEQHAEDTTSFYMYERRSISSEELVLLMLTKPLDDIQEKDYALFVPLDDSQSLSVDNTPAAPPGSAATSLDLAIGPPPAVPVPQAPPAVPDREHITKERQIKQAVLGYNDEALERLLRNANVDAAFLDNLDRTVNSCEEEVGGLVSEDVPHQYDDRFSRSLAAMHRIIADKKAELER